MIELYGSPNSSSARTRWMLEEVGVSYEYRRVDTRAGQARTPEYLRMYGGGCVPVLRDGDVVLGESMAINFYLAEKYGPELLPKGLLERAQAMQWSFWAITMLQPDLLTVMFDGMKPKDSRKPEAVDSAKKRLAPLLTHLDQSLANREYLVTNRFTVADCNAGSVANLARATGLLAALPNTLAWMERLAARPAFQRAAKDWPRPVNDKGGAHVHGAVDDHVCSTPAYYSPSRRHGSASRVPMRFRIASVAPPKLPEQIDCTIPFSPKPRATSTMRRGG